jgi:hypothetical protein
MEAAAPPAWGQALAERLAGPLGGVVVLLVAVVVVVVVVVVAVPVLAVAVIVVVVVVVGQGHPWDCRDDRCAGGCA